MNTSRTIEQLEADPWPATPSDASPMVARCYSLRKVPLEQLSAGDCRMLLAQEIGTKYVVPLALAFVEADPLLEGDYYPGDLLHTLFDVEDQYWVNHEEHRFQLVKVAQEAGKSLGERSNGSGSEKKLLKEINGFLTRATA